ncbi:cullin-1-like [Hibiscus syriacus]|nr:cullin-1-like [Hibiscus syriacus]
MNIYTTVYNMCNPNPTGGMCEVLYEKYNDVFKDYINSQVLPSLQGKEDEALVKETVKRWSNHKVMTRWLVRFFHYLDRYFAPKRKLPTLQDSALLSFYNLVFGEFNNQIRDVVLSMINQEREGEGIDQTLVKNIVGIYVDVGQGSMKYYERDFEEAMLKATAAFYSTKAANWIKNGSYNDYMLKVECYLKHERETVSCYLQNTSQKKLLEIVEYELISVYENEMKEKKQADESPEG